MKAVRTYPTNLDPADPRTVEIFRLYELVYALMDASGAGGNGQGAQVAAAPPLTAASLVGGFGLPPVDGATDPQVEQLGMGTLVSVTVTAGSNLTGGGTISGDSGTITLAVSATPSFTSVEATAAGFKVSGVRVVTAQQAGWTAATGTATKGGFDTATVTLPILAENVKALVDLVLYHGLGGA